MEMSRTHNLTQSDDNERANCVEAIKSFDFPKNCAIFHSINRRHK